MSGFTVEIGIGTESISILTNARSNAFELARLLSMWLPSFITVPVYLRPLDNSTVTKLLPSVTCAFVRMHPLLDTKKPVP